MKELREIDQYYLQTLSPEESVLFDAKLIVNTDLQENYFWQKKTYAAIKTYGRSKLKEELESIHQKLFDSSPYSSFRQKIKRIFKNI